VINTYRTLILLGVSAVVLADEWFKSWALVHLPAEGTVPAGLLALIIHKNPGIAFDLPFKMPLIIAISLFIGAFLIRLAWTSRYSRPNASVFALMVVLGALGNLYDRVAYGFTVDYLMISGRLAVNLCDGIIIAGVVGLLFSGKLEKLSTPPLTKRPESGIL